MVLDRLFLASGEGWLMVANEVIIVTPVVRLQDIIRIEFANFEDIVGYSEQLTLKLS